MWCIYFLLCVLLPICIPVPEVAVVLWGTGQIGSVGAFLLGVAGSVLGLAVMHTFSSLMACRILRGRKEKRQLAWLQQLTGQYGCLVLGVLFIVPLVSDEVLCAGSAFLKIPLPRFLKIGIIAKILSVGMAAFSGSLGALCGLKHWQVIAGEVLLMLAASACLRHFGKGGKNGYEGIHTDCGR